MKPGEIDDQGLAPEDPAAPAPAGGGEPVCPECQGTGSAPAGEACPMCGGTGQATGRVGGG